MATIRFSALAYGTNDILAAAIARRYCSGGHLSLLNLAICSICVYTPAADSL